ncbi:MAG: FtsQ-type POTRA domain-containing protein [Lentisphaerae bacterium]|nr:FtsQ-type POTRA domain-containing protein [Lentisphaerota bacterium]
MAWFEEKNKSRKRKPVLRVSARRNAQRRDRMTRVAGIAAVPIAVIVGLFLLWLGIREVGKMLYARSDAFTIHHLEVRAASAQTRALARDYTQIKEGQNIFGFDIRAVRDYVMANSPNFQSMSITRYLPDTVIIEVVDRTPLVRIGRRGGMVADLDGYVFISRAGITGLPEIVGYNGPDLQPGMQLDGGILASLQLVEACEGPRFEMGVERVDIGNPEALVVRLEYAEKKREVTITWSGMGQRGDEARQDLLSTLLFVKQAFDAPQGRRVSQLDATIEGRLYGR